MVTQSTAELAEIVNSKSAVFLVATGSNNVQLFPPAFFFHLERRKLCPLRAGEVFNIFFFFATTK